MMTLTQVNKSYQQKRVVNEVNLSIKQGETVCLLGHSGCGKSTLLRIIAGLIKADSGVIGIDQNQCGMVFQEPRLLPWLSVAENLMLALPFWQAKKLKLQKVSGTLEILQLKNCEKLMPRELSGGMAQRVGIARALLKDPAILLMDEPFAALDALTRGELQKMLKQLIKEQKKTCLFVTHDIDEALLIGERILVMKQGSLVFEYSKTTMSCLDDVKQHIYKQLQY